MQYQALDLIDLVGHYDIIRYVLGLKSFSRYTIHMDSLIYKTSRKEGCSESKIPVIGRVLADITILAILLYLVNSIFLHLI